jgi:hypothetical protein
MTDAKAIPVPGRQPRLRQRGVSLLLCLLLLLQSSPGLAAPSPMPAADPSCELYPIALHVSSLAGRPPGALIADVYNGNGPGNFGWLSWTGQPGEPRLAGSLTPPGDSQTYVNPADPKDRVVSVGDWVPGKPGVSNSRAVRDALDRLKTIDATLPVWDAAAGTGSGASPGCGWPTTACPVRTGSRPASSAWWPAPGRPPPRHPARWRPGLRRPPPRAPRRRVRP